MVSGHLSVKKGYYYCVLSFNDELGKRKTKWISTGLPEKGNKKRAEAILIEERRKFTPPSITGGADDLFADFMKYQWLPTVKGNIELSTFSSYEGMLNNPVFPYFKELGVTLKDLKAKQIQDFYTLQSGRVKGATVKHYHAIIHEALEWAVKMELILFNPADRVDVPKSRQFIPEYYTADEIIKLFDCIKGDEMELLIKMACFYGLRKSEILGLKWSAIDFEDDTCICFTQPGYDRKTNKAIILVKYNHPYEIVGIDKKLDLVNTCAHEALHVCMRIYSKIGEEVFKDDSNESLAYLLGWVTECIYKTLTK